MGSTSILINRNKVQTGKKPKVGIAFKSPKIALCSSFDQDIDLKDYTEPVDAKTDMWVFF